MYASGSHVAEDNHAFQKVREVVAKLEASQIQPFNKVIVHWTRSKVPLIRGRITVDTLFDEKIVPCGLKWFTEFDHLDRGDMLTSEQHRCSNEKKKF